MRVSSAAQFSDHITQSLDEEVRVIAVDVVAGVLGDDMSASRGQLGQLGLHLLPHGFSVPSAG